MKLTPNLDTAKHGQRTTVTLAIVWIAAMAIASTPGWVRGVMLFVNDVSRGSTPSGGYKGDTTGVTHGK